MHCSIACCIILLICTLTNKCISWVQPQIGIYPGFLDIYSANRNFVNSSDLIVGQPYTLGIGITNSDQYDYLIQSCTYNDKYHFIDQNSCLLHDKFFLQMWENNMYQLEGATKRTFIHFIPPESFVRLECMIRILYCCGCAERACGRGILSTLFTYPQQVINLAIVNEPPVGIFAASVVTWPWWMWLLILLGLTLIFCLLLIPLLLCSRWFIRRRKVSDSKATVPRPNSAKISSILVGAKEMEANGDSGENFERPSVSPPSQPSTRIFHAPSDLPTGIAHFSGSQSRIATIVRQQQPYSIRDKIESRSTSGRQMRLHQLESVTEECEEMDKHEEVVKSDRKFRSSLDKSHIGHLDPERMVHQQTACEEKFFKKSDLQNKMIEEGYDRAQLTYATPERYFFHSEVV